MFYNSGKSNKIQKQSVLKISKDKYKIFLKGIMPLTCPHCNSTIYVSAKDVDRRRTDNSRKNRRSVSRYYFKCPSCEKEISAYTNFNKYKKHDVEKLPFSLRIRGYFIREVEKNEEIYL